ncbi:MAG TPA: EF-hand domain-containing protein [Caulobacterales bacterium]|nr:EF-hand domain-containing protein [Caulobacterales bacterium]
MKKIMIAASLLVLASAGVAAAQAPGGGWGPGAMLQAADANHDGTITRAEFDHARADRFASRDANHDGQLSGDEMPHWGGGGGQGGQGGGGGMMMRADANNDGVISRAEYDAQGDRMFNHLDANHDGSISQDEIQAMQSMMQPH